MHGDEPDNAQEIPGRGGYGPPILPEVIVRDYQRIRAADPSRPVLLNLGQGVAWDAYIGRGVRRDHPEDYAEYVKGCDIASFDIYPAVHDAPEVAGRLEFVARGVERLAGWAGPGRTVWNCIECTRISNAECKPTPAQVRSEVWMALVRGSRGLIYFVHQFKPVFREAALLDDAEMLAAVTAINREVRELAPVLNQPSVIGGATLSAADPDVPLAVLEKRHRGETYLFAVNLSNRPTRGTFAWAQGGPGKSAEVLGEARRLTLDAGRFSDDFEAYGVRRYRIAPERPAAMGRGASSSDHTSSRMASGCGLERITALTSTPASASTRRATATAAWTEATSPVNTANAFPPRAMARPTPATSRSRISRRHRRPRSAWPR